MALHRSKTERKPGNRLMRALTNPNFESLMPKPKDPDPNAKRLEDWKIARAIGARGVDFGLAQPDAGPQLPDADSPLFAVVIDNEVEDKLPRSYNIRSLQRDDWDRGYCQLKVIGDSVTLPQWDERCEWLRQRNDTYVILVITDQHDRVVCTGTLLIERKFTHGMSLVGHVEDLAVDPGQSGKNLGLRMLDALDGVSKQLGCYKTIVFCQESNVGFHAQKGFKKTGVEMTRHYNHVPTLKQMVAEEGSRERHERSKSRDRLGDTSRNPSPQRVERNRHEAEEKLGGSTGPNLMP